MKKVDKYSKIYVLGTQGIFSMIVYGAIGFLIGYFLIGKDGPWPVILTIIGVLIGLVTFVGYLMYIQKEIDKEKAKEKDAQETQE